MMRNSKTRLFFIVICFTSVLYAQNSTPIIDGKSYERPLDPEDNKLTPFKYVPVDPEFWKRVEGSLKSGNYVKAVVLGADSTKEYGANSDDGTEGQLATAIGLKSLKFYFGATLLFDEIIRKRRGTILAEKALLELSEITSLVPYDTLEIGEDLLASNEYGPMHEFATSFTSYHAGLYNLTRGLPEWAKKDFKKVHPDSYWAFRLRYLTSLGEIARNRLDMGFEKLKELFDEKKTPQSLKEEIRLQLARIHFEKGEFETAYKLYYELDVPLREKGRVLLERAWAKYYMKDYSKALGLIKALQAPIFEHALTPEAYILRMIIYKQLCHYEAVIDAADEFRSVFSSALEDIRNRKKLSGNWLLASMALKKKELQDMAQLIHNNRREYEELKEYAWEGFQFFEPMLRRYLSKDKEIQKRIDLLLEEETRIQAEELLSAEEQVAFLDYTSRLDELRIIRRGEKRKYEAEKISYLSFERISWPVQEYWTDELEDYREILRSRCGEYNLPSGRGGEFQDAPEEFK